MLHVFIVETLLVVQHRHARINLHIAGHLFVSLRIEPPEMDEADISSKKNRRFFETVPMLYHRYCRSILVLGRSAIYCTYLCFVDLGTARRPRKSFFGRQEEISCAKDAKRTWKSKRAWKRKWMETTEWKHTWKWLKVGVDYHQLMLRFGSKTRCC